MRVGPLLPSFVGRGDVLAWGVREGLSRIGPRMKTENTERISARSDPVSSSTPSSRLRSAGVFAGGRRNEAERAADDDVILVRPQFSRRLAISS